MNNFLNFVEIINHVANQKFVIKDMSGPKVNYPNRQSNQPLNQKNKLSIDGDPNEYF